MAGDIEGRSRDRATLFPERLDDLIAPDAPGRPGYVPADLLKLYVHGYLNQIRPSRWTSRPGSQNGATPYDIAVWQVWQGREAQESAKRSTRLLKCGREDIFSQISHRMPF